MDPVTIIALIEQVATLSQHVLGIAAQVKATASETDVAKIEAAEATLGKQDDDLHNQLQNL